MEKKKKTWVDVHADEVLSDNSKTEHCKQCKNCFFKDKQGHDRGVCKVFEDFKPLGVIDNYEDCGYFTE